MIEELYNKIDKFCNETDWSKYPTYEHALEDFIKGIIAEETKELEKENAELKKTYRKQRNKRIDELQKENKELKEKLKPENCLKLLAKEGYIKFTSEQLTKAKELLRQLVNIEYAVNIPKDKIISLRVKAEQFLNEVEK